MDETTKGYICGFFDGEGSVTLGFASKLVKNKKKKDTRYFTPSIQVIFSNTNFDVLNYVRLALGKGSIVYQKRYPPHTHWAPHLSLRIYSLPDILDVCELLIGCCVLKKKQLIICRDTVVGLLKRKSVEGWQKWDRESIDFFNEQTTKLVNVKDSFRFGRHRIHERPELYSTSVINKTLSFERNIK